MISGYVTNDIDYRYRYQLARLSVTTVLEILQWTSTGPPGSIVSNLTANPPFRYFVGVKVLV
jgi:hypothetical protein